MGRLSLSNFDGSPKCSARASVEELDHQVSKEEAIRGATFHLEGKSYAWWFYENYSLIMQMYLLMKISLGG